jgi:hypothetical protein
MGYDVIGPVLILQKIGEWTGALDHAKCACLYQVIDLPDQI